MKNDTPIIDMLLENYKPKRKKVRLRYELGNDENYQTRKCFLCKHQYTTVNDCTTIKCSLRKKCRFETDEDVEFVRKILGEEE